MLMSAPFAGRIIRMKGFAALSRRGSDEFEQYTRTPAAGDCCCIWAAAARTGPKVLSRLIPRVERYCASLILLMGVSSGQTPWLTTRQSESAKGVYRGLHEPLPVFWCP